MASKADADVDLEVSVARAAASIGLTPATLRTWDRRYGLSPSVRTAGGHRRYSADDLARLRTAALLITEGVSPASAALAARTWSVAKCRKKLTSPGLKDPSFKVSDARPGGGRALAAPGASAELRGLTRAAIALDGQKVAMLMTRAIDESGVVSAWEDLAVPALTAVGDRWAKTGAGVEIEHVTSEAIGRSLDAATTTATHGRPILLACAADEQHSLPLRALTAALTNADIPTVTLGSRVPVAALADSIARLRPRAVVLWATMPTEVPTEALELATEQRPTTLAYLGGPGWSDEADQVQTATRLVSLRDAFEKLAK